MHYLISTIEIVPSNLITKLLNCDSDNLANIHPKWLGAKYACKSTSCLSSSISSISSDGVTGARINRDFNFCHCA